MHKLFLPGFPNPNVSTKQQVTKLEGAAASVTEVKMLVTYVFKQACQHEVWMLPQKECLYLFDIYLFVLKVPEGVGLFYTHVTKCNGAKTSNRH